MIYVALAYILFLLRYALAKQDGLRKKIYFLILISLFIFSAFRYQVGCDWSGYYNQYLSAAEFRMVIFTEIREPIWWAILGWIQDMGLPYPVANML